MTLYFEFILNISLWRFCLDKIEANPLASLLFAVSLPALIFFGLFLLFNALVWPCVHKPILTVLILLSCAANYVMFQFGVFIDSDMMANLFQTSRREALDFVNPSALSWLALTGLAPSFLVMKSEVVFRPALRELRGRLVSALACLLGLGLIALTLYKEYAVFGRNNREVTRLINPTNFAYSAYRYFERQSLAKREFRRIDEEARLAPYEDGLFTVFVLIVGETARSMNFALNGYDRPTNPRLQGQDVISFRDVTASGTSTAISVPAMFSHLPRSRFSPKDSPHSENILDLLSNAGYEVIWLENDNGCKKVCERVRTRDMVAENNREYCDGTYCHDEVMSEPLDDILANVTGDTVIVLHTMGSHGPSYYKRYSGEFRFFQPTCDTSEIQNCGIEAIVNTYDNTIVYTDNVVDLAIESLKEHPNLESGLLYVSDHGESLGENGIYLHGLPFGIAPDEQIKVPMILWMSEAMKTHDHIDYECLKSRALVPYSHDYLFHSLAGLLEIDTRLYEADLDLFLPCRLVPLPKIDNKFGQQKMEDGNK
jgi:lipid A ethanolaminephosphotransferase